MDIAASVPRFRRRRPPWRRAAVFTAPVAALALLAYVARRRVFRAIAAVAEVVEDAADAVEDAAEDLAEAARARAGAVD